MELNKDEKNKNKNNKEFNIIKKQFDINKFIKPKFKEHYIKLLGDEDLFNRFLNSVSKQSRVSFRINTLKIKPNIILNKLKEKKINLTKIPWARNGYFFESNRRDIGNLIEHALGYIYSQEASSMIPAEVLNPRENDKVIDMCAAPGSKTTQLASIMNNKGMIVANEIDTKRIKSLSLNLQRSGVFNTVITQKDASKINLNEYFDKVLLDAPCSGTGTIRKSVKTLQMWNPKMLKRLAKIQKRLINSALRILKPKGILVYSTCSLEFIENELNIQYILDNYDVKIQDIDLEIKKSKPILEFEDYKLDPKIKKCLRIWPFDNDTDGFFVCKIKKL